MPLRTTEELKINKNYFYVYVRIYVYHLNTCKYICFSFNYEKFF